MVLIPPFHLSDDVASRITPGWHCALSGLSLAMKSGWPAVVGCCEQD